jgi:hypothetical protein
MLFGKTISYCVLLYAYNNTHEFVGFLRIVESRTPSSTRASGTRIRGILYEVISNNIVLWLLALNVRFTYPPTGKVVDFSSCQCIHASETKFTYASGEEESPAELCSRTLRQMHPYRFILHLEAEVSKVDRSSKAESPNV